MFAKLCFHEQSQMKRTPAKNKKIPTSVYGRNGTYFKNHRICKFYECCKTFFHWQNLMETNPVKTAKTPTPGYGRKGRIFQKTAFGRMENVIIKRAVASPFKTIGQKLTTTPREEDPLRIAILFHYCEKDDLRIGGGFPLQCGEGN